MLFTQLADYPLTCLNSRRNSHLLARPFSSYKMQHHNNDCRASERVGGKTRSLVLYSESEVFEKDGEPIADPEQV